FAVPLRVFRTFADLPNTPQTAPPNRRRCARCIPLRINRIIAKRETPRWKSAGAPKSDDLYLDPRAGDVIAHGHEQHDREPENGTDDHELCALRTVLAVHEEENHERRLEGGDHKRDDDVETGEVLIQIDL